MSCLGTSCPFYSSQISCSLASQNSLGPVQLSRGVLLAKGLKAPMGLLWPQLQWPCTEESRCFEVLPNKKVDRTAEEKGPSLHLRLPVPSSVATASPFFRSGLRISPYHGMELFSQSSNSISQGREPSWTQFWQIRKELGRDLHFEWMDHGTKECLGARYIRVG